VANIVSYLEKKRLQFPRFFFISDRALLTILGQTDADSRPIHAHLSSLFAAAAAAATTYSVELVRRRQRPAVRRQAA